MQQIVATRTFSLCFSSPVSLSLLCPDSRKNEYPFLGREESISSNKHLGAYQQPTCLLEELCSLVPALRPAQLRVPFTTSWGRGHRESAGAMGLRCTATGAVAAQYEAPEDAIAGGKGFSYLLQTVLWRLQVTDLERQKQNPKCNSTARSQPCCLAAPPHPPDHFPTACTANGKLSRGIHFLLASHKIARLSN